MNDRCYLWCILMIGKLVFYSHWAILYLIKWNIVSIRRCSATETRPRTVGQFYFGKQSSLLFVLFLLPDSLDSSLFLFVFLFLNLFLFVVFNHGVHSLDVDAQLEQLEESVSHSFVQRLLVLLSPFDLHQDWFWSSDIIFFRWLGFFRLDHNLGLFGRSCCLRLLLLLQFFLLAIIFFFDFVLISLFNSFTFLLLFFLLDQVQFLSLLFGLELSFSGWLRLRRLRKWSLSLLLLLTSFCPSIDLEALVNNFAEFLYFL